MPTQSEGKYTRRELAQKEKRRKKKAFYRTSFLLITLLSALFLTGYAVVQLLSPMKLDPQPKKTSDITQAQKKSDTPQFIEANQMMKRKTDFFTFLICGVDYTDGSTRSDVMMVAAYDVKNGTVSVVNVPRDTISDCTRHIKKINGAYNKGIDQLKTEVSMILGIPIDRYAVIDFHGFETVIDAIGGVEYEVPFPMKYDDHVSLHINIPAGKQVLDGKHALHFIRYRQSTPGTKGGYADGDLGRINARAGFLKAALKQAASPKNLLQLNDIVTAVFDNTKTDMRLSDMLWLGLHAVKLNPESITISTLPGSDKLLYEADFGAMQSYYIPDEQGVLAMVNSTLNPYLTPVTTLQLKDVSGYLTGKPKK